MIGIKFYLFPCILVHESDHRAVWDGTCRDLHFFLNIISLLEGQTIYQRKISQHIYLNAQCQDCNSGQEADGPGVSKQRVDLPTFFDQQQNENGQDDILQEGLLCSQRDAVSEATAGPYLPGKNGISCEIGEKQSQGQQQPAEEGELPSEQQGCTCNDLEGDHQDGQDERVVIKHMPAPYFKKLLHFVAESQRIVGLDQSTEYEQDPNQDPRYLQYCSHTSKYFIYVDYP